MWSCFLTYSYSLSLSLSLTLLTSLSFSLKLLNFKRKVGNVNFDMKEGEGYLEILNADITLVRQT